MGFCFGAGGEDIIFDPDVVKLAMIDFARAHVVAALQTAAKNVTIDDRVDYINEYGNQVYRKEVNKSSILNCYPHENIK